MIDYMVEEMLLNAVHEQRAKHAGHTPADDVGDAMRLAILVEEVGEVANELQASRADHAAIARELAQVAAVACAWLEWLTGNCLKITAEIDGKEWIYLSEGRWRNGEDFHPGIPQGTAVNGRVENL